VLQYRYKYKIFKELNMEKTDKIFSEALRELLDERKLTYRDFSKKSKVSVTYLTKILVHNLIPSKEIIEKIAIALDTKPQYFKEYRIMVIISKLEKYYSNLSINDISKLETVVNNLEKYLPKEIIKLNKNNEGKTQFKPEQMLNLSQLEENQSKILRLLYEEYIKINEEKKKELRRYTKMISSGNIPSGDDLKKYQYWCDTQEGQDSLSYSFKKWKEIDETGALEEYYKKRDKEIEEITKQMKIIHKL
jgi:transcriptional regulator with XRE-family HTH domain